VLGKENKWAPLHGLEVKFSLAKEAWVLAFYQVTMHTDEPASHLLTKLVVNSKEMRSTVAISGETKYWTNSGTWVGRMRPTEDHQHHFSVEYRTPGGGRNNPENGWHSRALTVVVFGV
jgi:hypothetical protein